MSTHGPAVVVRPLTGADREAWQPLWDGYLSFYGAEVDAETTEVVFQRLVDRGWASQFGLVAEAGGVLVGLAHCGLQPSTWSVAVDCYLEDLFVAPAARRAGAGRALLAALLAEAGEQGWRHVHWLTDAQNATARRLYDDVGALQGQVRYVAEP